jgi:Mg2+ and Co2+ transporter CorA
VFGMNVALPFHTGVGAFWAIVGVMVAALAAMIAYFRRRGFL